MKIFSTIIEVITSPFTILFRTKAQKNVSKSVNIFLVLLIALIITCGLLVLFYYKELWP